MRKQLLKWYKSHKRDLPWRKNRDPYRIWISEVMLQQTTVAAVIPFYERFMSRFPNVTALAQASEEQVIEMWAGLGYYSRARNIHKAAQTIAHSGFPKTAEELINLPGFGPYTANAVASLAFSEKVGVLDGNVIRILTRVYGLKTKWWLPKERNALQVLSTDLANSEFNADVNQAMMELGATVCTPKKPLCFLCPWKKYCKALANGEIEKLPLRKPKQESEIWQWNFELWQKGSKIHLEPNMATPFLSGLPFPKSRAQKLPKKPKNFHLKHSVTKYQIYINLTENPSRKPTHANWHELDHIKKINPSSLMTKILKKINK